jgi:hypothetical protein
MVAIALLASSSPAAAGGKTLYARLDGRTVVPAGSGALSSLGEAYISLNAGKGEICYQIRPVLFYTTWPPTGATINQGAAGTNGPAVVDLGAPVPPPNSFWANGCVSASSDAVRAIRSNSSNYYVQVYNEEFPNGAIRGQLTW